MEPQKQEINKWLVLMVVVIGSFMAILDTSIVNIAIPKMMAVFGVSADEIKWVLTAYMLVMGGVIPVTGYLGDRFGTNKVYIVALVLFTVGSALCGFAWSNSAMIVARIVQAIGGGLIMPVGMAIIYQVVRAEERGMVMGIFGIAAMAAPAIGPTLSGYIVQYLDWRLIFTVNIPVGIVGVIIAAIILPDFPRRETKGFDLLGFITVAAGLGCILYVLGEGGSIDWQDFKNIFLLMVGSFSLVLFVINELTCDEPLLDLRIMKIGAFSLSLLISSAINIALFGGIFLLPLFLQNLQGMTAMQTGMLMFPSALATGITMPIGGKLFDKFGGKPVVIPGLALLTFATYELSKITLDTSADTIMWLTIIRGIGMGLSMMPSTTVGMNAVPMPQVGRASALNNVVRQVAGSVGLTVITTIMQNIQTSSYIRYAEQVSWFDPGSMQMYKMLQGLYAQFGLTAGEIQGNAISVLYGLVQRQATVKAIEDSIFVTFLIALVSTFMAFFIGRKKPVPQGAEKTHVIMD